jgi:hypothetical protein
VWRHDSDFKLCRVLNLNATKRLMDILDRKDVEIRFGEGMKPLTLLHGSSVILYIGDAVVRVHHASRGMKSSCHIVEVTISAIESSLRVASAFICSDDVLHSDHKHVRLTYTSEHFTTEVANYQL